LASVARSPRLDYHLTVYVWNGDIAAWSCPPRA
jgi:hypothetical protein